MSLKNVPTENLIKGIKKAYSNAVSFLDDAYSLSKNKKWAHAYSFCQFAIEELSKNRLFFQIWISRINGDEIDYDAYDSAFKNHIEKSKSSIKDELFFLKVYKKITGKAWVDKLLKKNQKLMKDVGRLNKLKNESLYVTLKNKDFQSPDEIITKEMFDSLYGTAHWRKIITEAIIKAIEKNIMVIAKMIKEEENKDMEDKQRTI